MVHSVCQGLWLNIEMGGYGSFADELMNSEGALARYAPDLVLFVADNEDLAGDLRWACASGSVEEITTILNDTVDRLTSMLIAFRRHSKARLLVQGLLVPDQPVLGEVTDANLTMGEAWAIRRINEALAQNCRNIGDAVFFDVDTIAARCGKRHWRDERMFRSVRLAVATANFNDYARAITRTLRPLYFPARKVLCTDLDNTLWGGIVGEDGPDKIASGSDFPGNCFREYQRLLLQLSRRGVLLTIASKNNEADVKEAFERRKQDLLVSLDHFAATQVGWHSKVLSLRTMAKELSLGLDSFVMVDDSPMECAEIRQALPEVLVIQAPTHEPWRIATEVADHCAVFEQLTITEDDRQRVTEYRAQRQRSELEAHAGSREEFLASLGIVCQVSSALEAPLSRTVQLIGKTNQFNLTTRRHSEGEVKQLAEQSGSQAWALRVKDRFGDAGVVGIALCRSEGTLCVIDTFLLSCRVIGRSIETALLWHIAQKAKASGATYLIGEFIPTKKNAPCADFYPSHGFVMRDPQKSNIADTSGTLYELDLLAQAIKLPTWITFEEQ
jgi:FkbH-like protein